MNYCLMWRHKKNTNVTFALECPINADRIQTLTFKWRIFGKKKKEEKILPILFLVRQIRLRWKKNKYSLFPKTSFICFNMLNSS